MKIKLKAIFALSLLLAVTGCSRADMESRMQEQIKEQLIEDIESSEEYKSYLDLAEEGKLDENGCYVGAEIEAVAEPQHEGEVRVTFADNIYIDVQYFYDEALTKPVDITDCYLGAGDRIYAAEPIVKERVSNTYEFSCFRVWRYGADGNKIGELVSGSEEDTLVVKLPQNFAAAELSVEPVGVYRSRTLLLVDYYFDRSGSKQDPYDSRWVIDDVDYFGVDSVEISSVSQYEIKYIYNAEEYFVKKTSPEYYSNDDIGGTVYFRAASALDENNTYTVELSPYTIATFEAADGGISSVKVNGVEKPLPCRLDKLKCGDRITIETNSAYKVVCDQAELSAPEELKNGYLFAVTVPDDTEELSFTVKKWAEKTVHFDVPRNDPLDWLVGLFAPAAEDSLLTVKTGDSSYTYKDLKNGQAVTLKESDSLSIIVADEIKDYPNMVFSVSVNGANPQYIGKASADRSLKLPYSSVETVKIEVVKGYVFSYENIDNGRILVQYLLDNGATVEEGQFLPVGTQVRVNVDYCPNDLVITGGTSSVVISESTKSGDFVVNSQSKSDL